MLSTADPARAALFLEFADPHPAAGNGFGDVVVVLSTGNVVVTSPYDDFGGVDAGAVYLFNGTTGALISALRGSTANDQIGSHVVTPLTNGNFVIGSPFWDNGGATDAGAATWGSGTSGVSGTVSSANSLVGSTANDWVGEYGATPLSNGNYVVGSQNWNSGAFNDVGAATWGSGTIGVSGVISAANSLVGSSGFDHVGFVVALSNGHYVVVSGWTNGGTLDVGAATWCNGTTGRTGVITAANSLVGSAAFDEVGSGGVIALTNGHYVVISPIWNNGGVADAGAVTWCNGTTGRTGAVSAANSLVGSAASDRVGGAIGGVGVKVLTNGNYVVVSPYWDNGAIGDAGAATWGSGTAGVAGAVGAANSLVGSTPSDLVGFGVTTLTNGNYVVHSLYWDNGGVADAGAATWGSGTTGVSGAVAVGNSLVGSTPSDNVGSGGVTALTNGNYVVSSPLWNNGGVVDAGAATWGSGTVGVSGAVSAANSLVGSTADDEVSFIGVTPLTNGNYVVISAGWDNAGTADAGAVTWASGTTGVSGVISAANSLVGSTAIDVVGSYGVTALSNGNYVVVSPSWDNGGVAEAGAATWGSGTTGVSGVVSAANSLVGSTAIDVVGNYGVTALTNGNYVVSSPQWDNGAIADAGAASWGNGTTGVSGVVSIANSLVGSTANDQIGRSNLVPSGVAALASGDYVVSSEFWDNGAVTNAGAVSWGNGTSGVSGAVPTATSLVGATANAGLRYALPDDVNGHFFGLFAESGGRVRVGPPPLLPAIVSAADTPNDQGGWLRLTFNRYELDDPNGSPPVTTYGVWRHVPGTLVSHPDGADPDAALPPGTWELVVSVPALQQAQYLVAVPTISNAAPNDFVVTAHTTTPAIWLTSNVVSGQSVDNLAPAQPVQLTASYSGGQTNLQWAANTEPDVGSYRVYRGNSADFTPSPGNRIATPSSTSYADVGPAGSFYKLSAVDVNGNESGYALIMPGQTTDVGEVDPVVFALESVRPNPVRENGLHVSFSLPTAAPARLELVDVSGRRVVARDVGTLGAGRHTVDLAEGRSVAPGLYWVRLTQGADRQKRRVAVIE